MVPRIVIAARKNDALGRRLAHAGDAAAFELVYCADRTALLTLLDSVAPTALVVALHAGDGSSTLGLLRRVKGMHPALPVTVVCLDATAAGRDVLAAARAGVEQFAFAGVDDLAEVLRSLAGAPLRVTRPTPSGVSASIGMIGEESAVVHATARRQIEQSPEYRPARSLLFLPHDVPVLLRRMMHLCVGAAPPRRVDDLAQRLGMSRRTLGREASRRGWPAPSVLLQWGRLFRAAAAANDARLARRSWSDARAIIARAGGYASVRAASRAFRARAGIGMREVLRDGAMGLVPAFLGAVDGGSPGPDDRRLAS